MPPVRRLSILYDGSCGFCIRVKDWIGRQAPLVPVDFVASGSAEAVDKFRQVPAGELAVVADTGEVWLGNQAWIVCLWALRDYRDLAVRLSSPFLLLMAREAFALVSSQRSALSAMLPPPSDRELEQQLRKVVAPRCQTEAK
jgi:predicted DCC family thiol-disulfide oxidoreductase YuxK